MRTLPHPSMAKKFTVAAVAIFSFFLIGGGGGGRAVFRAAVLVRTLFIGLVLIGSASFAPVTLAVRITATHTHIQHSIVN